MIEIDKEISNKFSFSAQEFFNAESDTLIIDNFALRFIKRPGRNHRLFMYVPRDSSGKQIFPDKVKDLPSHPEHRFEYLQWGLDNLHKTLGITLNNNFLLIPKVLITPDITKVDLGIKTDHAPKVELKQNLIYNYEIEEYLLKTQKN